MNAFSKITVTLVASVALVLTFNACSSGNNDDASDSGKLESSDSFDKGNDINNYRTVPIGSQTWMAENLNYYVNGSKCYGEGEYGYTEAEVQSNCSKYGRLYDWETAKRVCPDGWRLPSQAEWNTLTSYIENDKECTYCDDYLKATSGWVTGGNGSDAYAFTALPGGDFNSDSEFAGYAGYWWSASEYDTFEAYARFIDYLDYADYNTRETRYGKHQFFSVRCIKD